MFEALGERLAAALKKITGRGVLRPEDVEAGLREVRLALLEADVNFKVVKEFVERVRARLTGTEISPGLTAPQTVVKAVSDELVELLGGNSESLRYASHPPTVVMLVGLQGSGKTTTAVKLALLARREGHRPLVAALDFRRPAAVEQLKTLAARDNVPFGKGEEAIEEAARLLVDRRIRRLPVMAQGRMVGLLSRSDVLDFFASSQWTCQACGQGYRGLEAPSACDFCSGTDFRLERGSLAPGT